MARWHSSVLALFLAASRGAEVAAEEGGAAGTQLRRKAASSDSPIYVLTDMGFDDWGAFSVLHAAGRDPKAILTTEGMMSPSDYTYYNFSKLLASWEVHSPIYQGPDGCHHDCLNTTFIEAKWGYQTRVRNYTDSAVNSDGPEPSKPSSWDAFPWTDCKEKKYRLLILSPLSQYDFALWKDAAGITKCISEVVLSGAHFGYTEGGRVMSLNDLQTWAALIDLNGGGILGGRWNYWDLHNQFHHTHLEDIGGSDESNLGELNVVADALAASRSLGTTAASDHHVKVTIIPLEVESIDRYGMQMITNNSTYNYTPELQHELTREYIRDELCKSIDATPGKEEGRMVHRMACVKVMDDGTQNTLDMDAIVASYFWKPELFEFKRRFVAFDELTGLTYSKCTPRSFRHGHPWAGRSVCLCQGTAKVLTCFEANLATGFDAIEWFSAIKDELIWPA